MSQASDFPLYARVQGLLAGFITSQALFVVAELRVADELVAGPRTVQQLAVAVGAQEDQLRRVIRYLAGEDVFRTDGDKVELTDLGRALVDAPGTARSTAMFYMHTHYLPFSELLHTVRTGEVGAQKFLGQGFFPWVTESPRLSQLMTAAMSDGTSLSRGNLLADYELPPGRVVADIGGADGTLLTSLLAGAPKHEGIVFDLPMVVAEAERTIKERGLDDRVKTVGGSFLESVPTADTYILSHVLHDWDTETSLRILGNIAKAATPGARLLVVDMVVPDGDAPHFTKSVDMIMMALVGGRERSESDWKQLLTDGGFRFERIVSGASASSLIEATLA